MATRVAIWATPRLSSRRLFCPPTSSPAWMRRMHGRQRCRRMSGLTWALLRRYQPARCRRPCLACSESRRLRPVRHDPRHRRLLSTSRQPCARPRPSRSRARPHLTRQAVLAPPRRPWPISRPVFCACRTRSLGDRRPSGIARRRRRPPETQAGWPISRPPGWRCSLGRLMLRPRLQLARGGRRSVGGTPPRRLSRRRQRHRACDPGC